MANLRLFLLSTALAFLSICVITASASPQRSLHKYEKKHSVEYTVKINSVSGAVTFVLGKAVLPAPFVFGLTFEQNVYPKNSAKYDNRIKSYAQLWRDFNLKSKLMYS